MWIRPKYQNSRPRPKPQNLSLETRPRTTRKPRDAAAVLFGLNFADNIHYKFKSSQASTARPHSSKHTGGKQTLTQNGHSGSFKVTCFGVSGKAISTKTIMLALFVKVPTTYNSARNFSCTKDPQSCGRSQIFCGSRSASAHLCWSRDTIKYSINRPYSKYAK